MRRKKTIKSMSGDITPLLACGLTLESNIRNFDIQAI